jgi:small subunit ribosomal protein S20
MVRRVREASSKEDATKLLNETKSYLDKLVGKGIVKANSAANKKRQLQKYVDSLG